nr:MAG TPA: hypothetical protein [Caudoviricetes sp.]
MQNVHFLCYFLQFTPYRQITNRMHKMHIALFLCVFLTSSLLTYSSTFIECTET